MNQEQTTQKFSRGKKNSITDLKDVRVGHLTVSKDFVDASGKNVAMRTGLTAILPYPMEKEMRLFARLFSINGRNEVTGYEVLDDFCYLNSPIVITNASNVGTVYNAILSYGFLLGRSEVWPPLVIGINDSFLNDMGASHFEEDDILKAFHDASNNEAEQGSVGIGLGLRAFGWKGGVGTSSRIFSLKDRQFTVGVMAVTNCGNQGLRQQKTALLSCSGRNEGDSLTIIVGVDIPLLPCQMNNITERLLFSLPSGELLRDPSNSVTCLIFSTSNPMSMSEPVPPIFNFEAIDDSHVCGVAHAGACAIKEAIWNSMLKATPVQGKSARECRTIPEVDLVRLFGDSRIS